MKVKTIVGLSGKEIKVFTPETELDLEMLEGMNEQGRIDRRTSFSDAEPINPPAADEDASA
jgi:hypothetical protein